MAKFLRMVVPRKGGWIWTWTWLAPNSHLSLPPCFFFPGGADKNVIVFDKSSEQILATLKGHSKKVTSVVFHPSQVRSGPRLASSLTARLPQIALSGPSSGCSVLVGSPPCADWWMGQFFPVGSSLKWRGEGLLILTFLSRPCLGLGVLSFSRCYYPHLVRAQCLVRPGCPCPRGLCDRAEPPRDRRLPPQLF